MTLPPRPSIVFMAWLMSRFCKLVSHSLEGGLKHHAHMLLVKNRDFDALFVIELPLFVVQERNADALPRAAERGVEVPSWKENFHDIGAVFNRLCQRAGAVPSRTSRLGAEHVDSVNRSFHP